MQPQENISEEIHAIIKKNADRLGRTQDSLIPILQAVQDHFRYIPEEAMEYISKEIMISVAEVYGVVTFYAQFRTTPVGKFIIKVCLGTACHVGGAPAALGAIERHLKISDGQTTPDGLFTLQCVACLGCCSMAPVMMIDETIHAHLTDETIPKILDSYKDV